MSEYQLKRLDEVIARSPAYAHWVTVVRRGSGMEALLEESGKVS